MGQAIFGKLPIPSQRPYPKPQTLQPRDTNFGFAELEMGQTGAAVRLLTRSLEINSEQALVWSRLGRAHLILGDAARALEEFSRAVNLTRAWKKPDWVWATPFFSRQ